MVSRKSRMFGLPLQSFWRFVVFGIILGLGIGSLAWAQGAKGKKGGDVEKKSGTISEIKKKGKGATITVEERDGEKFDVEVTTKTHFLVRGTGDKSFFKHGTMHVSSENIVANNNYLFGKNFTIFLGGKGPAEQFESDPLSPQVIILSGTVTDGDDDKFTVVVDGTSHEIAFEQGKDVAVAVESTEIEHAVVGAKIEIEGTTRAAKFNPSAIVVTLEKPMPADEAFAGGDKKGKSKTAKTAGTKKTATKTGDKTAKKTTDKSEAGDKDKGNNPLENTNDPFDVNKKDPKSGKGTSPKKDDKGSKEEKTDN